jgi:hypothetical protein
MKVTWIYESPDKGKTVYRRPFGKSKPRQLIRVNNLSTYQLNQ